MITFKGLMKSGPNELLLELKHKHSIQKANAEKQHYLMTNN